MPRPTRADYRVWFTDMHVLDGLPKSPNLFRRSAVGISNLLLEARCSLNFKEDTET
jgi:hypothetical protein